MSSAMALVALTAISSAGEVRDSEARMRGAYADYRAALFATNAGKAEQARNSVKAFRSAWDAVDAAAPPPQYEDDPEFADTVKAVAAIADAAQAEIAAGDLAKAHETLEGIREQIGDLHARNGVQGFSDRMNAYHARMELVIGMSTDDPVAVAEQAAILDYLAADVAANPPAGADESFNGLMSAVTASVGALQTAARSGDGAAIKAAIGGLKVPYSKLFLKFG
jgi:hypothetical protein